MSIRQIIISDVVDPHLHASEVRVNLRDDDSLEVQHVNLRVKVGVKLSPNRCLIVPTPAQ